MRVRRWPMLVRMIWRSMIPMGVVLATCVTLGCTDDGGSESSPESTETSTGDGDGDGDASTSGDGDGDASTSGDGDGDPKDFGDCGNGMLDEGEVCDDGNNVTEFPPYAPEDCIDNCSMVLATCNDGNLDEGEDCDDGNADSKDECTTSCTVNDKATHASCTTLENGEEIPPPFNVSEGDIVNCDDVELPTGADVGCNRSFEYIGNNAVYAAGGDCQIISLKCGGDGDICPPGPIGDYDAMEDCPEGHVFIEKFIEGGGVIPDILSRVCLKACESDRECRWNEEDTYWGGPGEYRCSTTPQSNGALVCQDRRNNDL